MKVIVLLRIAAFVVVLATVVLGGEAFARFYLGLGTPPLSVADTEMEYMFRPNQDLKRFGNRIMINRFGMRSAELSDDKPPSEIRVLAIGDSVINGGNLTDQSDLATRIAQDELSLRLRQPVVIANVSAGSWGPGNYLAYLRKYGDFGARIAILVLSSHDAADEPTFAPLDPNTHPTERPFSALVEGVQRYLPRYLPAGWQTAPSKEISPSIVEFQSELSLKRLVAFFARSGMKLCVFQHPTQHELATRYDEGYRNIRLFAEAHGVAPVDLGAVYRNRPEPLSALYRDDIHLAPAGQRAIADAIIAAIEQGSCKVPKP